MDVEQFFDENCDFYGSLSPRRYDYFFLEKIDADLPNLKILDIGGGGGTFAKLCQTNIKTAKICIVDPSLNLLQKQNLDGVKLVVGKLPQSLNVSEKFDYIHIKEVLHHIVGSSVSDSRKLFIDSIISSKNQLNENGFILLHELFYESYFIPTLTRTLIFYLLKAQNLLKIKIPTKECLLGLEVCFYTRKELREIFQNLGLEIIDYYEESWNNANGIKNHKLLFLKNWGRMCFVLKPCSELG